MFQPNSSHFSKAVTSKQIVRAKEITAITSLHRTTIERMEKAGLFPKRFRLGARSVGWLKHDIDAWIESRALEAAQLN
jgi:prophage regulatory protein